jgi:hypothetical protein
MSKKKNYKKKFNPQIIREIQAQASIDNQPLLEKNENLVENKQIILNNSNFTDTKNDLKRIFLTTLFIFILLFVVVYISKKTNIINNFGDWLVKTIHLNN